MKKYKSLWYNAIANVLWVSYRLDAECEMFYDGGECMWMHNSFLSNPKNGWFYVGEL